MPTILHVKGYRSFFYSNDHEPMHIHIEKDDKTAKFELIQLELVKSRGFNASELKEIRILVTKNINYFKNKWNEYFIEK